MKHNNYILSQVSDSERKNKAMDIVESALKTIGIIINPEIKPIINGVIESTIYVEKTPNQIKAQSQGIVQNTVTALQKQIAELQTSNAQLTQKNADLTNKINVIQSTVVLIVSNASAQ